MSEKENTLTLLLTYPLLLLFMCKRICKWWV